MNKFGKIIAGILAGTILVGSAGTIAYKYSPTFKDKVDKVFHIGDKKDDLKKQIEELKQQLEDFKGAENTIKNLQAEKTQLQAEKEALQKQFDENQKQIETLQAEKAKLSQDMQAQIDELNARIANLEKSQTDLQKRIDNLEKRVETLETQVADLQKQVADKQTQIDKLSDKITDLWSVFENYTIYTDSTDKGETPPATEIKKSDKEALEERIAQLETKVSELENTKADKETEKHEKQKIINNYNNQKTTINQTIENNTTIINNCNTTINNNTTTINDYSKTIDSNNTTISNNNNTIKELEQKESRTDEEQTQLDNLKKENSDLQSDNATKQSEIERLQTEIDTARTNVEKLEKTNQEQQAKVSDLEKRVSELEGEVKTIDNDISNLDKSINSLNSQINKFQNFIKNSTIIDDSGTTDPNPDTPSEQISEYGSRVSDLDLTNLNSAETIDSYFAQNTNYTFNSTADKEQIGTNNKITTAYYMAQAVDENSSIEMYFILYKNEREPAFEFAKNAFPNSNVYIRATDNMLFVELNTSKSDTPETPSEDTYEAGTKYFTEFTFEANKDSIINFFNEHSEYSFNSTDDVSGIKEIPSAVFEAMGFKNADKEKGNYKAFSIILFDNAEDKSKALDYVKNNMGSQDVYYKITSNMLYVEVTANC